MYLLQLTDTFLVMGLNMIKAFFQKHHKSFLFSLVCNILVMSYCLAVFYCVFETNDDYSMKMIAMGAYGDPESHLVYINSIFGYLLKFLYSLVPGFAWYEILQYVLTLLSLSSITYVLLNKGSGVYFHLLVFFLLLISGHFLYVSLQYTKTASLLALSGYLLLDHSLDGQKRSPLICSLLLINSSYLFRKNQFLLISLVCAGIFLPRIFLFLKNRKDKEELKKMSRLILSAGICLFLFFALRAIGRLDYSGEEWKTFRAYNSTRAALLDREGVTFSSDPAFYGSIGLNETDITMLYDLWDFDDPKVFDLETMKNILEHQKESPVDVVTAAKVFVYDSIDFFFGNKEAFIFTSFLLSVLVLFLFGWKDKADLFSGLCSFLLMGFCIGFTYVYRNYAFLERVHLSLVLAGIVSLLYRLEFGNDNRRVFSFVLSCMIITVFLSLYWFDGFRINSSLRMRDEQKIEAIKTIREDEGHLYVRTTDENLDYVSGLFLKEESYVKDNVLSLGGWMVNTPIRNKIKEKYGINNPFSDIINNDRVYLIISEEEKLQTILRYIKYHYDPNAKAESVTQIRSNKIYEVYKIVSD